MTPGPNNTTIPSTTSGTEQQGVAVSVAVETQPSVFGTRTVYTSIPSVTSPPSASGLQEPPAKRRKVEKNTVSAAPAKTVRAMQQYGYRDMVEANQALIRRLTQPDLKNVQKVAEVKKLSPAPQTQQTVSDTTKNMLRQHLLASAENSSRLSATPASAIPKLPEPLQSKVPAAHAQKDFAYGSGDIEAKRQLQKYCETISDEVAKFCSIHIAPDRFYLLFNMTAEWLLGVTKDQRGYINNQFIAPEVLGKLSAQKFQYLLEFSRQVYQTSKKYKKNSGPLLKHMVKGVSAMHPPPVNNDQGVHDVLSYYSKALKVRGLKCSTEQLMVFLRQAVNPSKMENWLKKQGYKRAISQHEYAELLNLLEMADRHCRYHRYFKSIAAKGRQKTVVLNIPAPARPADLPLLTGKPVQPREPVDNISTGGIGDASAARQPDDKPQVPTAQPKSEQDVSPPVPDMASASPQQTSLDPVYRTDILIPQQYPGIPNSGNYCYMITAIQFLRANIPEQQQREMIIRWRQKLRENSGLQPETVTDAFSALLSVMSESREKLFSKSQYRQHKGQIEGALKQFAALCLKHESLGTEVKGTLRHRKGAPYIHTLQQNDAQGFLMKLQQELGLDQQNCFGLYEQLEVDLSGQHFSKPQTHAGATNVLMVPLAADGDIQKSLDAFLQSELVCRWTPQELAGARDLPAQGRDGYRTRQTTEIKTNPARLTGFTLCLKNTEVKNIRGRFKDQKMTAACEGSIKKVFDEISLPVTDPETGHKHRLRASPGFIIFHNGQDYQSGHYVSLWLQDSGWVLNDDDHSAIVLREPEVFLKENNTYPYLVEYRVTGIEPA